MVAIINNTSSLRSAVNYNEHKVKQGKANGLLAVNYPKDMENLNFHEKLNRLKNQAALRPRTQAHCVHIFLSFDPSEKLTKEQLEEIAKAYMEKIGFGDQPYLVYQHTDTKHPHLHIVSINIDRHGKRIDMHNLGKGKSQQARKEIEDEFGLVKAGEKQRNKMYQQRVSTAIDWALAGSGAKSLERFTRDLRKEGIEVVLKYGKDGRIFGIKFIDHKNNVVFKGSDLGKKYAAKAILERCGHKQVIKTQPEHKENPGQRFSLPMTEGVPLTNIAVKGAELLQSLLGVQYATGSMPFELKSSSKKKKRKRKSL